MQQPKHALRIIPLGGLGEIGKNMTALEYGDDIIILDLGSKFATEDEPGVDLIIPDTTYIERNKHKLRGIVITHGHLDHIGAAGQLLEKFNAPIYSARFTIELLKRQFEEYRRLKPQLHVIDPDRHERVRLGAFEIELVRVNHSIPDACAIVVRTPEGVIVDTGDWRFEANPLLGKPMDVARLREIGREGVTLLLGESTNADRPGKTLSERPIADTIDKLFNRADGRVIATMFASNVERVQMVVNATAKHGRALALSGRSMLGYMEIAIKLGYLKVPNGLIVRLSENTRRKDLVVLCTGSQGEENAALQRMANGSHREFKIQRGDTVIMSSNPIPGNEKSVGSLVDSLLREGATVFQHGGRELAGHGVLHTTGHASSDDLAELICILKPKYLMPVHGQFAKQQLHARLARKQGVPAAHIFILQNADVLELSNGVARLAGSVPGGERLLDGSGVVDRTILAERVMLGEEGVVVVTQSPQPHVTTAGFGGSQAQATALQLVKTVLGLNPANPEAAISNELKTQMARTPLVIVRH